MGWRMRHCRSYCCSSCYCDAAIGGFGGAETATVAAAAADVAVAAACAISAADAASCADSRRSYCSWLADKDTPEHSAFAAALAAAGTAEVAAAVAAAVGVAAADDVAGSTGLRLASCANSCHRQSEPVCYRISAAA